MARQRSAKELYRSELRRLQVALVLLQRHIIEPGHRVLVIVEGRDAAGKDCMIKGIAQHLSPRETRIVALGRPSDRDRRSWHFQRYAAQLASAEDEQRRRLEQRRTDPLKQWKRSPIDRVALKHWNAYSEARNEMLARTHNPITPWFVVRADDKRETRLNMIRHLLARIECPGKDQHAATPDDRIVFPYDEACASDGRLAA